MSFSDWADWWDRQKRETEQILEDWVIDNPQWWTIGAATAIQTSADLGQGFVDVLRLGEGVAEGTARGVGKDALRLLVVLGPLARAGAMTSRALIPLARAGNLKVAVQVNGVTGPCTFQAVNNALAVTRGKSLFVTIDDMAKALGLSLNTVGKVASNYKMAAWIDDLIPAIKQFGARVKSVTGLKTIDQVVHLAKRETGPVIFAFEAMVKNAAGATTKIVHSVIAYRTPTGTVRFADYGGKFVNTVDDLIRNLGYGSPVGNATLYQSSVSAAVVDGAWLTGTWASEIAKGAFLVLEGLAAIETPNGVEFGVPVNKAAAVSNPKGDNATANLQPVAVMKGSFEIYKQRRRGVAKLALPAEATVAGSAVAPKAEFLTGVQFRLNALGFASGPVDGIMGPLTRGATMRFQRANPPLRVDGIPGPRTQAALVSACGY